MLSVPFFSFIGRCLIVESSFQKSAKAIKVKETNDFILQFESNCEEADIEIASKILEHISFERLYTYFYVQPDFKLVNIKNIFNTHLLSGLSKFLHGRNLESVFFMLNFTHSKSFEVNVARQLMRQLPKLDVLHVYFKSESKKFFHRKFSFLNKVFKHWTAVF